MFNIYSKNHIKHSNITLTLYSKYAYIQLLIAYCFTGGPFLYPIECGSRGCVSTIAFLDIGWVYRVTSVQISYLYLLLLNMLVRCTMLKHAVQDFDLGIVIGTRNSFSPDFPLFVFTFIIIPDFFYTEKKFYQYVCGLLFARCGGYSDW